MTPKAIIELAQHHGASSYRNRADTQHPAYGFTEGKLVAFVQELLAGKCLQQIAEPQAAAQHPDDAAVDALAALMKAKLAKQRAKGYGGWDTDCTQQRLSEMLRKHVDKGDPVDVANFCAFLVARGEGIAAPATAPGDAVRAFRDYLGVHDGIKLSGHAMDDMALDLARIALDFKHLVSVKAAAPAVEPVDAHVSAVIASRVKANASGQNGEDVGHIRAAASQDAKGQSHA